jgi:hypothetical protein
MVKELTPMKAIRLKCLDCMCEQSNEIKACPILKCSLWKFRLGKRPSHKNNQNNPFLLAKNFVGFEKERSEALIKRINEIKVN